MDTCGINQKEGENQRMKKIRYYSIRLVACGMGTSVAGADCSSAGGDDAK